MVNVKALLHPQVPDQEGLTIYRDNLTDLLPGVEHIIARLKHSPQDQAAIADLFRSLHTLKGDAGLCQLEFGVMLLHPVESLLGRIRAGEIVFSDLLAEVVLLSVDRLELAIEALVAGRTVEHLALPSLVTHLEKLADARGLGLEEEAVALIKEVTGFQPSSLTQTVNLQAAGTVNTKSRPADDLRFFRELALLLDGRSPLFDGRCVRLLRLASDTNAVAGNPVDPAQLEAAVYMHDIGMVFMPDSVWIRSGKLDQDELALLQQHPAHGGALLARMSGWEEAARIVLQHHEKPDGTGYPNRLKSDEICTGAKILAIVDAFESIMHKHAHRGQGRSLLRAIAEVNACDHQFAPEWIAYFNTVVRKRIE